LVEWLSKPSLFASEACRSKVRRSAASKDYAEWLSAKFEPPPDLHVALLELAPEDAWTYRLDCPSPKGGSSPGQPESQRKKARKAVID
jgi:hypothetical protein